MQVSFLIEGTELRIDPSFPADEPTHFLTTAAENGISKGLQDVVTEQGAIKKGNTCD